MPTASLPPHPGLSFPFPWSICYIVFQGVIHVLFPDILSVCKYCALLLSSKDDLAIKCWDLSFLQKFVSIVLSSSRLNITMETFETSMNFSLVEDLLSCLDSWSITALQLNLCIWVDNRPWDQIMMLDLLDLSIQLRKHSYKDILDSWVRQLESVTASYTCIFSSIKTCHIPRYKSNKRGLRLQLLEGFLGPNWETESNLHMKIQKAKKNPDNFK